MQRILTGWVIEPETGLGIARVTVAWRAGVTASDGYELGTAVSGSDGEFTVEVRDEPEALEAFCRVEHGREPNTWLMLLDGDEQWLQEPLAVQRGANEVRVEMRAADAQPDAEALQELTSWLTTNRMLETGEVTQQLLSPWRGSPVANWTAAVRGAAVRQIVQTVREYDPQQAPFEVVNDPVYLEPRKLFDGDLAGAIGHYRISDNIEAHIRDFGSLFPRLPKSDIELYRDYLRGIWVAAARDMYGLPNAPEDVFNRQLEYRFLQNFTTGDHNLKPAATLAIKVLRQLLIVGSDRGGFGIAAGAIPPQAMGQSDYDYLQVLISLSGVSAAELKNRVRIRFDRQPDEKLHPVQLNVEALLGLLSDTWQTPVEPFNVQPVLQGNGNPIIFGEHLGRAPFFLQYEEWLQRQKFFPENAYDIRRNILSFGEEFRKFLPTFRNTPPLPDPDWSTYFISQTDFSQSVDWLGLMFPVSDTLRDALSKYDALDYIGAAAKLSEAMQLIRTALSKYESHWVKASFAWDPWRIDGRISLKTRARIRPKNRVELDAFEQFFNMPYFPLPGPQLNRSEYERRIVSTAHARSLFLYNLIYLGYVLVPYFASLIATAQGDFAKAVRVLAPLTGVRVGVAEASTTDDYAKYDDARRAELFRESTLPYTAATPLSEDKTEVWPPTPFWIYSNSDTLRNAGLDVMAIAEFEGAFLRLAQGDVMLSWADQLYRNDDPSSIRRARELYKAVLFLHGENPDIMPDYRPHRFYLLDPLFINRNATYNPAKVSQLMRARLGFQQIEMGLNAYGYNDEMVPVLRYKPLKTAADTFAASAKSAQNDFLDFQGKYEQARIDILQTQNLLKRAVASQGIAAEHQELAKVGVGKAEEQVKAVEVEIARKRAEAADADSFFGQAKAFFGGIKDSLTNMVPLAKGVAGDEAAASSVSGEQLLGILKSSTGGGAAAKEAATATLGSGAALAIGFGAFAYYGYTSMSSMADEANKRQADIKSLETSGLEAARAQVRLRQREVTIANFEAAIAEADASLARELYRFHQDRFLNADFWRRMALLAQNLMRRYVELGARTAWMAERALAFEQSRLIDVIRLNYVPYQFRGASGADKLQADLAELEAQHILGARATAPVKHSISLAREFPLAFGQLKATGKCMFQTTESTLRLAYPRMYGYRVRSLTIGADHGDGPPPKGVLRNSGVSLVSKEDGSMARLVRYPDALPLSEFRLHDDLFVYGLPGETLLQFEGSGFETSWELEFPLSANPQGLRGLSDVMVTFDMNATYANGIKPLEVAAFSRGMLLAASIHDRDALNKLRGVGNDPVRFHFDLAKIALPNGEANRTIRQIALMTIGHTPGDYGAVVELPANGASANVTLEKGLAITNDGEMLGNGAPLPLNALVGLKADQVIEAEIQRAGAEEELSKALDVVLYVEYSADPA